MRRRRSTSCDMCGLVAKTSHPRNDPPFPANAQARARCTHFGRPRPSSCVDSGGQFDTVILESLMLFNCPRALQTLRRCSISSGFVVERTALASSAEPNLSDPEAVCGPPGENHMKSTLRLALPLALLVFRRRLSSTRINFPESGCDPRRGLSGRRPGRRAFPR